MANVDNFTNLSEVIIDAKYYTAREKKYYLNILKGYVPELILVTNSDAGKLNARNVFYRYVNVSVTLIINDDSVGDLIGK